MKEKLYLIIKILIAPVNLYVTFISNIFPKKKGLILFIPRFAHTFEGNVKYSYLYFTEKNDFFFPYYLCKDKTTYLRLYEAGLPVLYFRSLSAIIKMLRTEFIVVDSNGWTGNIKSNLTAGSKKIQLWHGSGMKKVAKMNENSIYNSDKFYYRLLWYAQNQYPNYDLFLFGSEYQFENRKDAFRFKNHMINGNSRNDTIFGLRLKGDRIGCDTGILTKVDEVTKAGSKAVIISPTWKPDSTSSMINELDHKRLNNFAVENNLIFIIKLHPKDNRAFKTYSHIVKYDSVLDVYPLFYSTSCMITDYSSIYMDYILGGKPVIFFPYDYNEYMTNRGVMYDYNEITPGPKCYNQEELEEQLFDLLVEGKDNYQEKRKKVLDEFFAYKDGRSSERLYREIQNV